LTSKKNLFDKALLMNQIKDEVVKTYLLSLKEKIKITKGIPLEDKNIFYIKLDNEFDWYLKHQKEILSAGTLEDLEEIGAKGKEKYFRETEIMIYDLLYRIAVGKEVSLKEEISSQIEVLNDKIKEIKKNGDKDTFLAERWLLETENRLVRAEEKFSSSQKVLENIKINSNTDRRQVYRQTQMILEEALQYLKEANRYLIETVREIKTSDGSF